MRLGYSGTKIIQIFIVTNILDHPVKSLHKRTYSWLQKNRETKIFLICINLILSLCQLIVYLTISIK
jgi:DNA integrity scanning protein DisA with diadenylate cyclase activity